MTDRELNFAAAVLDGRPFREVPDDEVLERSRALLAAWMGGEARMERPKLYDHYALVFLALIRRVQDLEARVAQLEGRSGQ